MTYRFFNNFLAAAKQEQHLQRISDVHALVHRLPKNHLEMLDIIIRHLRNVASKSQKNKMSIFNLGVVFGEIINVKCIHTIQFIFDKKFPNLFLKVQHC
jgi:Rho GTPase-activating protein 26